MYENELYHHGVLGMKWGHRKASYNSGGSSRIPGVRKPNALQRLGYKQAHSKAGQVGMKVGRKITTSKTSKQASKPSVTPEQKAAKRKKAIKVGAAVAGAALGAYGAYKVSKFVGNKSRVSSGQQAASRLINTARTTASSTPRMTQRPTTSSSVANAQRNLANAQRNMDAYMQRYNQVMNTFGTDGTDYRRKRR